MFLPQPEEPKPKRPRGRPLGSKKKPEVEVSLVHLYYSVDPSVVMPVFQCRFVRKLEALQCCIFKYLYGIKKYFLLAKSSYSNETNNDQAVDRLGTLVPA